MIKKANIALILLLLCVFISPNAHALSIRLEQPKVHIKLEPGGSQSGSLGIKNPEEDTIEIKAYTEDWAYAGNGTGEKVFSASGTLPNSAASWLTLNYKDIRLDPFSRADVGYTVTVPKDARGTYHTVAFFETELGPQMTTEGARVMVSARLGAIFVIDVIGTTHTAGSVSSINIQPPTGSKPAQFEVTFTNEGTTDIELKGSAMILDASGRMKGRFELENIFTSGGMTAAQTSQWVGQIAPGQYEVIFTFDMGEGKLLTEERPMTVM